MPYSPVFRLPPTVRATLGIMLLALSLPDGRSEAQSKTTQAMPDYRLTEPMVRKVSAVMREWDPTSTMGARVLGGHAGMSKEQFEALPDSQKQRIMAENMGRADAKKKEGEKQIGQLLVGSMEDRIAAAERIPALKTAIGKSGLATAEFVQAYNGYHRAMSYVLSEGIRQDNVKLFKTMEKAEALWTPLGLTKR